MLPVATEITVHVQDGEVYLVGQRWPERAAVCQVLLQQCPELFILRYPFLAVRLANGRAVYRVETCERGQWAAVFLEGWVG